MNRVLAYIFVLAMLITVMGQSIKLQSYDAKPVTEIRLHKSRLLPFLADIQTSHPHVYDSIVFNLSRIRPAKRGPERYRFEEILVAEKLLNQLTGQ